jgi:hypothetical protein
MNLLSPVNAVYVSILANLAWFTERARILSKFPSVCKHLEARHRLCPLPLQVAEKVAQRLTGEGWTVLRPDRDAPHLMWEEYINWVSRQTLKGVPVIEIHGQGPEANMEGAVWGVIGDSRVPLNKVTQLSRLLVSKPIRV